MEACLIVGLGNPGRVYASTRHNAGFMVVDEIARRRGAAFDPGRGEFERASVGTEETRIHLLKPTTYMNGSGSAVREAMEQLGVFPERILIVLDDFQIPLGSLRMRPGGSDGGHNGLASVLDMLGTIAIPRLRCGIGTPAMPEKEGKRDFVLEPFEPEELSTARTMVARAADAAEVFASSGIDRAMNITNTQ